MAEGLNSGLVPTVRITHRELLDLCGKMNPQEKQVNGPTTAPISSSSNNNNNNHDAVINQNRAPTPISHRSGKSSNERAGFQPYRPGKGLQPKSSGDSSVSTSSTSTSKKDEGGSLTNVVQNTNNPPSRLRPETPSSADRKSKPKRPDVPLYVAKGKLNAQKKERETNNSPVSNDVSSAAANNRKNDSELSDCDGSGKKVMEKASDKGGGTVGHPSHTRNRTVSGGRSGMTPSPRNVSVAETVVVDKTEQQKVAQVSNVQGGTREKCIDSDRGSSAGFRDRRESTTSSSSSVMWGRKENSVPPSGSANPSKARKGGRRRDRAGSYAVSVLHQSCSDTEDRMSNDNVPNGNNSNNNNKGSNELQKRQYKRYGRDKNVNNNNNSGRNQGQGSVVTKTQPKSESVVAPRKQGDENRVNVRTTTPVEPIDHPRDTAEEDWDAEIAQADIIDLKMSMEKCNLRDSYSPDNPLIVDGANDESGKFTKSKNDGKSDRLVNGVGKTVVRENADGVVKSSDVTGIGQKLDWVEEVERSEWLLAQQQHDPDGSDLEHHDGGGNSQMSNDLADVESCGSPNNKLTNSRTNKAPPVTATSSTSSTAKVQRQRRRKVRRPKSESSTEERSPPKPQHERGHGNDGKRKSSAGGANERSKAPATAKAGGILHIPAVLGRSQEARGGSGSGYHHHQGSMVAAMAPPASVVSRQLYDPKNPNHPQVVYRPAVGSSHMDLHRKGGDPIISYSGQSLDSQMPTPASPHGAYGEHHHHGSHLHHPHGGAGAGGAGGCSKVSMYVPPPMGAGYMYPPQYATVHPEAMYYSVTPIPFPDGGGGSGLSGVAKLTNAQRNIREAVALEHELGDLLNRPFDVIDHKKLGQCRWKVQLRYENAILADVEFCSKHNIEQCLWKSAFYQVIETYRKQMVDYPSMRDDIRTTLLGFIEEGVIFYENLLEKLQEQYHFTLSLFLDSEAVRPHLQRQVKMALISAQKVLISLGDLGRYKEQANETNNYGKARSWYLKAQQLAPKNGRPYNQLAILSMYARRKLDAVYYYMRSLAASNPFQTAKDGLDLIFDEARKKYEQVEKQRLEDRSHRHCNKDETIQEKLRCREEIWLLPDGTPATHNDQDSPDESEDELNKLSALDLNKKFVLSFLHTHGKLFMRVGMDKFIDTASQMLREFTCLLDQSPLPVTSPRLLQIMAVNMFTIHHTELKEKNLDPNYRSLCQEHALQLSLEMFGILLNRSCHLLTSDLSTNADDENGVGAVCVDLLQLDLYQLLPAIKVWCDWLMCHSNIWNPRQSQNDYRSNGEPDPWTMLAKFLTLIKQMDTRGIEIAKEQLEGWEPVILPEDTTLAGFVPLLSLPQDIGYVCPAATPDKEVVRNVVRVQRLLFCAEYLCGISPAVLRYDVQDKAYKPVLADSSSDCSEADRLSPSVSMEMTASPNEETFDTIASCSANAGGNVERADIRELRWRKEELTRKKADQERMQQKVQAVLSETTLSRIQLEILPRFLIPDTNCFIDHFAEMKRLVTSGTFQLTVPLVVVNELEGLSKGSRIGYDWRTPEMHTNTVASIAKTALDYLKDLFASRNNHVRALTNQGTEMDTINFRSEDMRDNVGKTNDDLILQCCVQHSEHHGGRKAQIKDGLTKVTCHAVLLTDDKNLRLKALSQDVPVRDVPTFLRLMRIS